MDLLNRALEQVIDQLVTQKVALLKLEIENQKKTIFGKFFKYSKFLRNFRFISKNREKRAGARASARRC